MSSHTPGPKKTAVRPILEIEADERAFAESVAARTAQLAEKRRAAIEVRDRYDTLCDEHATLVEQIARAKGEIIHGQERISELENYIRTYWHERPQHEQIAELLRHQFMAGRLSKWLVEWKAQLSGLDLQIDAFQKQYGIGT